MNKTRTIFLEVFNNIVSIHCDGERACVLIGIIYSRLISSSYRTPILKYQVSFSYNSGAYSFSRNAECLVKTTSKSDFIYYFEKDVTIELQKKAYESVLFIHGAALEWNKQITVLSGKSGAGKSTMTWALLNHGFHYLSDELAPIRLESREVIPFPHSICLKDQPPLPYALPESTLVLERTWHLPISNDQLYIQSTSILNTFVFLEYRNSITKTIFRKLNESETMINIYQNALNQLAHANDGLTAVQKLANETTAYLLQFSDLDEAIEIIKSVSKR